MTKKHFIGLAVEFGLLWRHLDRDSSTTSVVHFGLRAAELMDAQLSVMSVCKRSNPNFDRDHFAEFVQEIRRYERDLDGRKIPVSKKKETV